MKIALCLLTGLIGLGFAPDPPAAPTGLGATAGLSQVTLDWNDNSPAPSGYNVYRSLVSGGPYVKANTSLVQTSAYTHTSLTNGTPYYFVVRAEADSEESSNSAEVTATPSGTDVTAPSVPVITSSGRKTRDTTPLVTGTGEPGSIIRLFVGTTEIATTSAQANGTWSVSPSQSLGSDGTYVIRARSEDLAYNMSDYSQNHQIILDTTAPEPPTNVRVMATPAFIDVEWSASASLDVAGYKVYRRVGEGSWTLLNTTGLVLITKYRDSSVSAGNNYSYRITAVDNALEN